MSVFITRYRKEKPAEILDEKEVWDAIHELSNIRAQYSVFDREECGKYHACSIAIKALRKMIGEDYG